MHLPLFPFVVLDTETTGFFPRADRVLELAMLRYEHGEQVGKYSSLFAIDCDIPPHVQVITRIRPEHLKGKPSLKEEAATIQKLLQGAVVVGHNITYDLSMLEGEGLPLTDVSWIDTAMLASLVFPELPSWSLGYLSTVLHLPHDPKHRALGDVHATVTLLEQIFTRLHELPAGLVEKVKDLAERGPEGYALLFSSLKVKGEKKPPWLRHKPSIRHEAVTSTSRVMRISRDATEAAVEPSQEPTLTLLSAPLSPHFLSLYLQNFSPPPERRVWVAVKNLTATRRILPATLLEEWTVIYPFHMLPEPTSKNRFLTQKVFTADELTLALKFILFGPGTEDDLPLHSEEHKVWDAKIACLGNSPLYREQLKGGSKRILIDHRQLLEILNQGEGPQSADVVLIDDASMLEDTATKAFRWLASVATLRAGAEGGESALTRLLDLLEVWLESVRRDLTIRYLVEADLRTPNVRGLRKRIEETVAHDLPENVRQQLHDLGKMLDPKNLEGRITWIEKFRDGAQVLQSVPSDISSLLWDTLYDRCMTTLFLPPGGRSLFSAIISPHMDVHTATASLEGTSCPSLRYAERELTLERLLPCIDGKVIALVSSKGLIEQLFVKFAERLEEQGITLIAQGLSGGQGRMQAEFIAAPGPAVWLLTPWMYEGVELLPESVDRLFLATLPFDHPSHAVLSRRAERYKNPFEDYFLPRLLCRLFRILRTYALHRKPDGDILVLDDRIRTKEYGQRVRAYLDDFTVSSPSR